VRFQLDLSEFDDLMEQLFDLSIEADASVAWTSDYVVRSVAQRAKNKIRSGGRSGRVYERQDPTRIVQASAPGEPPLNDLGNLADSITFQLYNTSSKIAYAGTDLFYGYDLELGTPNIAPRPFLYPAFREAIESAAKQLKKEFMSKL